MTTTIALMNRTYIDIGRWWPKDARGKPSSVYAVHKTIEGTENEVTRHTLTRAKDGLLEKAIRAWATNDPKAAVILAQVDRRRLDYTQDLFLQIGFTPFEAMVRARMAYYAAIGEYTIGKNQIDRQERLAQIRLQHKILTHKNESSTDYW